MSAKLQRWELPSESCSVSLEGGEPQPGFYIAEPPWARVWGYEDPAGQPKRLLERPLLSLGTN